ncbi:MAG: MGH1-like glycoside hydrolase domain-containing protein, partial [Chloroflexota bacterium]
DVKECYYYLDSTPTHSYMAALYKYPQRPFPYAELVEENRQRGRGAPEYELLDTGIFDDDRYFDVGVEYAKASPTDMLIRISVTNRGPESAPIRVLPTLWYRNTWAWGRTSRKPSLHPTEGESLVHALDTWTGEYWLACEGEPELLFTENETNTERLWGAANHGRVKDGIHGAVIDGDITAVTRTEGGTKMAAHYQLMVSPGATEVVRLRLSAERHPSPFKDFHAIFAQRRAEADEFYCEFASNLSEDERRVQRQAFAGLMWCKQHYHFNVQEWLDGDPAQPSPPAGRLDGRNRDWFHLNTHDVLSMPDAWEYPWFAAWDLAFHCIPLAMIDPEFAKKQITVLGREWYQHPNGQLPAYEWAFGDVNPPVHAWAAWRVYKIEQRATGRADRAFLEEIFHKLLLNFTWWVNRKDLEGRNVFQGGFLGLDNIGVFDRSAPLPVAGHLEQSDGTAWMGMYCLNMLTIALELARENPVYESLATKFFEHFLYVAAAMNNLDGEGISLWDNEDEFFYDVLHLENGERQPLRLRSLVGLIPLLAVETIDPDLLEHVPEFRARLEWFLAHRPDLAKLVSRWHEPGLGERRLLALVRGHRMKMLLKRMLDPNEFLADHGIRSMSRTYAEQPYAVHLNGSDYLVQYQPAESSTGLFGGNSNWRGPIWFPINFLLIESIQKFQHYYGDEFQVECPTGSGETRSLREIASELSNRLISIFTADTSGQRPVFGASTRHKDDPAWRNNLLFHEYFCGDTGRGVGASHQTGWTALIAKLLEQAGAERTGGRLTEEIAPAVPSPAKRARRKAQS